MLTDGFWCYIGKPISAGSTNDLGLFNQAENEILKFIDERDLIISDGIFKPLQEKGYIIAPWKRNPNQEELELS